jgi:transposase InsO family protein
LKPKDVERIRLLAIKLGNHRSWKTGQVVKEIERRYHISLSKRTVQLWKKRYKTQHWNLKDKSKKPHTIHRKITPEIEQMVVDCKKRTRFDSEAIQTILAKKEIVISVSSVKRIIRKYSLQEHTRMKGERLKWVRWQRNTPNSLWQFDWTEEDELIAIYGKPRQILTDNHSIVGGTGGTNNQFDKWCKKQGIEHIRGGVNKPTTTGKVEKLHDTYNRAIKHWNNDPETWRYSYNHNRPHRSLHGKTPAEVYNQFHRLLFFNRKWTKSIREKTRNMS